MNKMISEFEDQESSELLAEAGLLLDEVTSGLMLDMIRRRCRTSCLLKS